MAGPSRLDGVQIVRRPGHDVAGAGALVKGVGQVLQVAENVVAHLELDFARDADHDLAVQVKKNAFGAPHAQDQGGINEQLLAAHSVFQVVKGAADEQGNGDCDAVLQQHANAAQGVAPAVLLEVRKERLQSLEHARI